MHMCVDKTLSLNSMFRPHHMCIELRLYCVRIFLHCVISEQDRGLDQLSHALRRQREVGLTIQGEVEEQNGKIQYFHITATTQYNVMGCWTFWYIPRIHP